MKKLAFLTILATIGMHFSLLAQVAEAPKKPKYVIPKNTVLISGSISGMYSKPNFGYGSGSAAISANSGLFVIDNLCVGIDMGYSFRYSKNSIGMAPFGPLYQKIIGHAINPGFFLRYYKMFTPKFGLLGQFQALCAVDFVNSKSNDPVFSSRDQFIGLNLNLAPKIVYFVTRKLALEAGFGSIGYNYSSDLNSGVKSHSAGFNLNPNLDIGLAFYLGKGVQEKK